MNKVPASRIGETMTIYMSKAMTTSINKLKQQLLAKEVFSSQITKYRRERVIPLSEDETWSADSLDKSSLSKYNNNYNFILTVIDIFPTHAWAIPLEKKIRYIYN